MIPLKLETLLEGRVVEHDRVEYKRGWNPSKVITTICAYANDFSNTNGGYVVIGIEEKDGRPILPPAGLNENHLDKIQRELFQYCNFISPRYTPQTEIVRYQGKSILYLWCSAGDSGPYSSPESVVSKDKAGKHKEYWIKPSSVKTIAKGDELSELFDKFNSVPFDDRVNRPAKITDVRRGFVEDFLVESNSSLASEINNKSLEDLLVALEVANVTDVGLDIRNIGLLMFSERPEKFLPGALIELIRFNSPDAEGSDDFTEKIFTGPLQKQVRDALSYIKAVLIEEKVVKHPDRAEADRFYNYPYSALEEALVNAVFHKSYRIQEPVEIRVYLDSVKIINYPGPEKWIDMEALKNGRAIARRYRNRRIGEFLKEIDLSEKKSTGITKILRALKKNGSPLPEFETDSERNYFIVTIHQHESFKVDWPVDDLVNDPVNDLVNKTQWSILNILKTNRAVTYEQIAKAAGISTATVKRNLKKLQALGMIIRHGSDKTGIWEIIEQTAR
ncbi:MAG: putative DNA binding domain-containing protein [Clostridiales bacterium]|jgi:ATP-dependent DNA helicase RecG|nr:putative DNA binding domain-containing protein [Clostridiales bacterium]